MAARYRRRYRLRPHPGKSDIIPSPRPIGAKGGVPGPIREKFTDPRLPDESSKVVRSKSPQPPIFKRGYRGIYLNGGNIIEINSLQVMFMLGAAAASALLGVVAIGLWTRILATSGRTSRRAELAADQLESTTNQFKEYMERTAAEPLSPSAGVDTHQSSASPGLEDGSEQPERSVKERLRELIHQRRVSRLGQEAARSGRPSA